MKRLTLIAILALAGCTGAQTGFSIIPGGTVESTSPFSAMSFPAPATPSPSPSPTPDEPTQNDY